MVRLPTIDLVDDGPGKPVGINSHIGRRPIAAFGNSDGDFQMLQWATAAPAGKRFGLIVQSHAMRSANMPTTASRPFGKLDKGLDAASANGWTIASMKDDWKRVFGFQQG